MRDVDQIQPTFNTGLKVINEITKDIKGPDPSNIYRFAVIIVLALLLLIFIENLFENSKFEDKILIVTFGVVVIGIYTVQDILKMQRKNEEKKMHDRAFKINMN